jgi:uncharacterized protein YecT (DUF1311 family)
MRAVTILTTAFFAMLSSGAMAANDCASAKDQMTSDKCANNEFVAADKKLNATFQEIKKRLGDDADTTKLLVAAQRAWILFRDAECTFQSSASAGGSIYPMVLTECKAELTRKRTNDLKSYLSCEEGDMSCPLPAAQ